MHPRNLLLPLLLFSFSLTTDAATGQETTERKKVCKVFLLAGQSNMVGHGVVDLDHEKHYNSGQGNLASLLANEKTQSRVAHLRDEKGHWTQRDDVFIRFESRSGLKAGKLSVGFTNHQGPHHFGPELQFGNVVGDHFDEPVLLLKAAWGGKSLLKDFAPPSSGKTGEYFTKMISEFRDGLKKIDQEIPQLAGYEKQIAGFVWMQGWNDMVNDDAIKAYSKNLIHFVGDVRDELGVKEMPFVVGELGNGGKAKQDTRMFRFRRQQAKACVHPPLMGTVDFVPTSSFARPAQESPNVTHAHHWFGNAESYFLVGDALGKRMVKMIKRKNKPRVLILGDSISMGYTPHVREMLSNAWVIRPKRTALQGENCAGTNHGIRRIDQWLSMGGGNWDVIHFNFGLHDLKHVDPETRKNSNKPTDPQQADPETYRRQLEQIVVKLKSTGAKLIFATTTPIPEGGVKPYRALDAPENYNRIAKEIMSRHGIEVNDLHAIVAGRENELMKPVNVHFKPQGSKVLAKQVTAAIRKAIKN